MLTIKTEITGVSPLIMNRFTDAAAQAATDGQRLSTSGERADPKDDARGRLYVDDNGKVIMPAPNLLAALTAAGKYFKSGRSKVSTQKSSLVPACMFLSDTYYPLVSKAGWCVDSRPVRIPATGGRILRYRPIFHDWRIKLELQLDTDVIPANTARDLFDAAGKKVGLCDFRPETRGPFGRFKVDVWHQS